jgi:hypothetical protein
VEVEIHNDIIFILLLVGIAVHNTNTAMRKKLLPDLLLILLLLRSASINAQCPPINITAVASPPVFCSGALSQLQIVAQLWSGGYVVYPISYAPVSGVGTPVSLADDQVSQLLPIGFDFIFFGNLYNQFNICSNGFISFTNTSTVYNPVPLPDQATPNNFIAGAHMDLNPGAGGNINYFVTGTAPNRELIVNFDNVVPYSAAFPVTMQFILYETTNVIEIHTASQSNYIPCLEGIENSDGTLGIAVPGRNAVAWTAANDAWRFLPGDTILTYAWSPSTGLSDSTISNPVASPLYSTRYIVTATDTNGCTGSDTLDLVVTNPIVTASATPQMICAGDSTQLNVSAIVASTFNYAVDSIPFAPVTGAGTPVGLGDDEISSMQPIGFYFSFYGVYYSEFNIGSNGFITFDSAATANNYQGCCAGQAFPNASNPNSVIAAAWEDLNPSAGGTIKFFNTGIFPFESLVIQFTNVPHAPARDSVTFEIILYETTNIIEIHTTAMPGNPHGYWYAHTQGIEDAAGVHALTVPGRNSTNTWTAFNEAWRFTPVSTLTYSWSPSASLNDPSIYNPVGMPASTTDFIVTVIDSSGCAGTDSIQVTVNPLPPLPVVTFSSGQLHSGYAGINQWYFNGVIVPGAVLPDYTPPQTGDYYVTITDSGGCSSTSAVFFVVVGIDDIEAENNFIVYPNPAAGKLLSVSIGNAGDYEFILYDVISGKVLQQFFSKSTAMDIGSLAKGLYFYEIRNKNQMLKKGRIEKI